MDNKTMTKMILLQVLGLAALLFGRVTKISLAIAFLTDLVMNKWDEIWAIGLKSPAAKAASDSMCAPSAKSDADEAKLLAIGEEHCKAA